MNKYSVALVITVLVLSVGCGNSNIIDTEDERIVEDRKIDTDEPVEENKGGIRMKAMRLEVKKRIQRQKLRSSERV